MKSTFIIISILVLIPCMTLAEPPSKDYKLVWSDEFDGPELDLKKWDYRGLGPRRDAINVKDCVSFDGQGHLVMTTKKAGDEYHTAMIGTQGKFDSRFGYYECRVKFQTQIGHWSAFWLQSPTIQTVGDPKETGTEIDIFEYLRNYEDIININLHWNGYGEHHQTAGKKFVAPDVKEGFHTIGFLWTPEEYVFYVDDKEAWRTDQAVSHIEQYIILSLEVGKWAGDIKQASLPDRVYFDYVRVYRIPESKALNYQ